jgi:nitrate/TMAO reductase-like tetraheme cytochrome c subunit
MSDFTAYRAGEVAERERIINFIEQELSKECPSDDKFCSSCHAMNEQAIELLRFIRGEE